MFKDKDYFQEIMSYIKKNLKKGYTKDSLKWALMEQGYSKIEVDRAFKRVDQELAAKAPILKTKPKITYEIIEPKESRIKIKKQSFWKRLFRN